MENNLKLPQFLKLDTSLFDFEFQNKPSKQDKAFFESLQPYKNKENTLVLYNGKVISNKIHAEIETELSAAKTYRQQPTDKKLQNINKEHLNSFLKISFKQNAQENIFVVNAFDGQFAHANFYQLGENSNVKILEKVICSKSSKLNHFTDINMEDYSHFDYVCFENLTNDHTNVFGHEACVKQNGELDLTYLNLNNGKVLHATNAYAEGFESKLKIETVTFANNHDVFASNINAQHLNKQTNSLIHNIAVVNDFAYVNIDGVNKIENGNSKSNAEQETKIINLKESANSVANPQLIINEYDVKAGHAAAVGKIDEDQLFYLQSRGLTKVLATEILLMAYVNEILDKVDNEEEKALITKIIKAKIN